MQTFLPYPNFRQSAQVLDRQRLMKQAVEVQQIMLTITSGRKAWANHPAVRMWRGHEFALLNYGLTIGHEIEVRGYSSASPLRTLEAWKAAGWLGAGRGMPPWLGDQLFHETHRGNLVRKAPAFYAPLFPGQGPVDGYVWPVDKEGNLRMCDMRRAAGPAVG